MPRSLRFTDLSLWAVLLLLPLSGCAPEADAPDAEAEATGAIVYIGTSSGEPGTGIHAWRLDPEAGVMEPLGLAADTKRPGFLALHPSRRFLYAVGEGTTPDGQPLGVVRAFAVDPETGVLTLLNEVSSEGANPAHVSVDQTGRYALVANYTGGSVAVLPIGEDGRLGAATDTVRYAGSSVNPQRQQEPHPHAVGVSPDNRFVFVPDLGQDKFFVYRFDAENGTLTPNDPPYAALQPGAGPRHFAFHPKGRFVYVINELLSTVTVFAYDAEAGTMEERQTITTLPPDFSGENTTAEVKVHPNGRFLYGSNRGHNSIVAFSIDADTGALAPVAWEPTQGETPRNFGIDPRGAYLIVGNQNSDSIVPFRINAETGRLTPTGQSFEVASPTYVAFLPLE